MHSPMAQLTLCENKYEELKKNDVGKRYWGGNI